MPVLVHLALLSAPADVRTALEALDDPWTAIALLAAEPLHDVELLSRPTLMTRDGEAATVDAGEVRFDVITDLTADDDLQLTVTAGAEAWTGRLPSATSVVSFGDDLVLVVVAQPAPDAAAMQAIEEAQRARREALPPTRRGRRRALQDLLGSQP